MKKSERIKKKNHSGKPEAKAAEFQKKIALINDLSGFGRCSLTVSLPIISALKVECAVLPTCILSSHTAYPSFYMKDCTEDMDPWMDEWKKLDLKFDGIYTGFLGSEEQIEHVVRFINLFKLEKTLLIVDPVMGDHGKIYSTYTDGMCEKMKELAYRADILTPNLTEACRLTDTEYREDFSEEELAELGSRLRNMGPSQVVITGIERDGKILNLIFEQDKKMRVLSSEKIEPSRHGTGDVFASVLAAKRVQGDGFEKSVKAAAKFVRRCLKISSKLNVPPEEGVAFEELLTELK